MTQLALFAPALVCAFGTDWPKHDGCPYCRAEEDRLCAQFVADVAAGIYDADGYRPSDRNAQATRRVSEAGREV